MPTVGGLKSCNKEALPAHATFISPELLFGDSLSLPTSPFRLIMEIDSSPGKHRQYIRAIQLYLYFFSTKMVQFVHQKGLRLFNLLYQPCFRLKACKGSCSLNCCLHLSQCSAYFPFLQNDVLMPKRRSMRERNNLGTHSGCCEEKEGKKPRLPMGISSVISQMAS